MKTPIVAHNSLSKGIKIGAATGIKTTSLLFGFYGTISPIIDRNICNGVSKVACHVFTAGYGGLGGALKGALFGSMIGYIIYALDSSDHEEKCIKITKITTKLAYLSFVVALLFKQIDF